ncbi:MAG TPA: metallophosphoesterase [Planctomycetota bacterium]|nr:metallophosphoesterase [Planctomycetota bacterium]
MAEPAPRPADYVMKVMAKAAAMNQQDPFLRGRLIELPGAGDLMITGDLHGNLSNFRRITRIADLPHHPHRHLILQEALHAMYRDTPDRSYQLIEEIAIFKTVYPAQVHVLLANHDLAELYGLQIMKQGRSVLRVFDAALEEAYQFNKDVVRKAYNGFLRSFPWAAATPTGLFVCHSLPDAKYVDLFSRQLFTDAGPDTDMGRGSPAFHLAWGRDLSGEVTAAFAQRVGADLILTGHHPCRSGHTEPNPRLVILDSKDAHGAYAILPLDVKLSQIEVVSRIKFLNL